MDKILKYQHTTTQCDTTCTMNYYSDVTTYRFYNKRHQLVQRASIVVICFTLFRNVRPCMILGYTPTNIPQKLMQTKNNTKKNLHQVASRNRRRTLQQKCPISPHPQQMLDLALVSFMTSVSLILPA